MSRKGIELPLGSNDTNKIIILCTKEQEEYIKECGCIAYDDDKCDSAFCDRCNYSANNIEYRRK